jgi:TolB-like protein/Tfp pilus assembly protein PilF
VSLVAELKRRSVFKVGVAYLVVGWLVIQVAATVAPQMSLPDWAPRLITLCILLGFPVALVLAWIFDVTPEGVKLDAQGVGSKRVFTAAAIIAALAIGWFMGGGSGGLGRSSGGDAARVEGEPSTEGAPKAAAWVAPLGDKSTAVLPFVNMSSDKENEYFSDGLTETLLHKLAQVSQLKVAARTSSFAFKGKQEDIRAIGRELGVATVMEGSVQRSGDTLRITAQLVRTADGSHIWSQNYDRKVQDLFAIQDEIAIAVTEALVGALVPEAKAAIAHGGTQDLAAYDLYTKALQQVAINSFDSLKRGEALLQQAIAQDPRFVDAMLALGATWSDMSNTGIFPPAELDRRIAPLLDRIAALDPEDGLLLALRGEQARRRGDGDAARALFTRAVAVAPGDARVRSMNGLDLGRNAGASAEGLAELDRAAALDPLNADHQVNRAFNLRNQRRFDEMEQAARRAIELDPRVPTAYTVVGDAALTRGDLLGMLEWYMKANRVDPHDHEIASDIGGMLQDLGQPAAADAWLAEAERLAPGTLWTASYRIVFQHARGEHAKAVDGALALAARHDEERRGNWANAMGAACLSAIEVKRLPELRAALVKGRAMPAAYTADGFRAIDAPSFNIDHQLAHIPRMAPCYFDAAAAGAKAREQLYAAVTALKGPDWAAAPTRETLAAMLRDDREGQVTALLKGEAPAAGSPRALRDIVRNLALAEFRGLRQDPRMVARVAEAARALAEQHAALPARLAAEGLSLLPAAAPTKAP